MNTAENGPFKVCTLLVATVEVLGCVRGGAGEKQIKCGLGKIRAFEITRRVERFCGVWELHSLRIHPCPIL